MARPPCPKRANIPWVEWLGWLTATMLLAVLGPLFVRMPLWADPIQYDLAARAVMNGGIAYRDIADINLPGMVWLHVAVRSLFGWSFEALRLTDLAVVMAIIWLLIRWWQPIGFPSAARPWMAVLLLVFYFATSEMCHCQRDTWMLLPVLGALYLRRRRLRQPSTDRIAAIALLGMAEGATWGVAFWIKPHVALPALACWSLSLALVGKKALADMAWIVLGGLLVGAAGVAWLFGTGAWLYFVECCLGWSHGIYSQSPSLLARTVMVFQRFYPWGLIHLAAVPLAVGIVLRACAQARATDARSPSQALLAACYLGWLVQVHFLQLPYDYPWAPLTFLALAVVTGTAFLPGSTVLARGGIVLFVALALVFHPLLGRQQLALWARCWQCGNASSLRDRLSSCPDPGRPNWEQLDQVKDFLRAQDVGDGELTCYHASTQSLYLQLDIRPSTRYVNCAMMVWCFPDQLEMVRKDLNDSPQRFVVSDLLAADLTLDQVESRKNMPEDLRGVFPWYEPVVLCTGRYVVQQITGPVARLTPDFSP